MPIFELDKLIRVYNSVSEPGKIKDAIKRTAVLYRTAQQLPLTESNIKQILKNAIKTGHIARDDKTNTYHTN